MPVPRRLRQLEKRLDVLERHFLPPTFSPSGAYSSKQNDHTKAYVLLAHAELESFFEDLARAKVNLAERQWNVRQHCSPLLSRLVVFHCVASDKKEIGSLSAITVRKALNFYSQQLGDNHGIKEKHLLAVYMPLGLNHQDLDSQLVSACNQLAMKRGQFAHSSVKTHQQVDPKAERDNIRNNIIPQLKKLNLKVKKL